jgi:hypothetical protein
VLSSSQLSSGCKILNSHNVTGWRFSIWGYFLVNQGALLQFHSLFFLLLWINFQKLYLCNRDVTKCEPLCTWYYKPVQ